MAIEAIKGQKTLNELSMQYDLLPKQISDWKTEFLSKASLVFTKEQPDLSKDKEIHELHARIGELDAMVDFLKNVKYPYLLRGLQVTKTNQVWEMDITYIPMRHGFMYLSAIIDVFSRRIMAWGLSNTMEAEWCAGIVDEAFNQYGRPEIFNTDQGCQFTSGVFISTLQKGDDDTHKIKISMDGRGRATDDIYIERFWRSIKYEDLYVKAYENGESLYDGINSYMLFYNGKRLHESLDYQTPDKIYHKVS